MIKHPVAIQLHAVLLKLTAIIGPKKYPPIAPNKTAIIHSDIPIRALSDSGPILLIERNFTHDSNIYCAIAIGLYERVIS